MANEAQQTSRFVITVNGSQLGADIEQRVVLALVEDSVHLPDTFVVAFRDPARDVVEKTGATIGASVEISLGSGAAPGSSRLFRGDVTALEAEFDPEGTLTIVRGYDRSHRLTRGRRTKSYLNMTYSDIARKVAADSGLDVGRIDTTSDVYDHVTQGNQSDWDFVRSLASEICYECGVYDGKFEFRKPEQSSGAPGEGKFESATPLQLTLGVNLLRFRVSVSASDQVGKVSVRGWDPTNKNALVGSASASTSSTSVGLEPRQVADLFGNGEYVSVERPFRKQGEVDGTALAFAEQIAASFAECEGTARGSAELRAGKPVSLSQTGSPFDGSYVLTSTRHQWDPDDGYRVDFTVSGRHERSIGSLTNGSHSAEVSWPGVAIAVVTDCNDPEKQGRVKLKFPWLSDDFESFWARIAFCGAGDQRGAFWLPEVNDEVLVAFEGANIRYPYVIGGLYNGMDKPKLGSRALHDGQGRVNRRMHMSRMGHFLEFGDESGTNEGVLVASDDEKYVLHLDKGKTTVRILSDGKVEIVSKDTMTITSTGDLTVDGKANVTIKAAQQLNLNGASGTKVDGGPQVEVKGSIIKLN